MGGAITQQWDGRASRRQALKLGGLAGGLAAAGPLLAAAGAAAATAPREPPATPRHQWKVGNAYQLAREIRKGLGLTSVKIQ